jgi:hypothetical protein
MSAFAQPNKSMDTKIGEAIVDETSKLNKCIQNFLNDDNDIKDFTPCCNKYEINLLVYCYNIFFPNTSSVDMDFIKALIAYYYNLIVFEYYFSDFIEDKYLKIVTEITENVNLVPGTGEIDTNKNNFKLVTNNYEMYTHKYDKKYDDENNPLNDNFLKVEDVVGNPKYYVRNTYEGRKKDPYFYKVSVEEPKHTSAQNITRVKLPYLDCLDLMALTSESQMYYRKLSGLTNAGPDEDKISNIRRTLLGFNTEQSVYEKEIAEVDNVKVDNVKGKNLKVDNVKGKNLKVDNVKGKNLKGKEYYDYWVREISKIYWGLDIKPPDNIDLLLEKYNGKEHELIEKINIKYNPNYKPKPATAAPPPLPSRDSKNYKEIITAFYQKHNPAKLEEIPTLLEKYKGKEEEMIAKLKKKYEKPAATAAPPPQKDNNLKGGYKSYKGRKKYMKRNTKKYVKKDTKKYVKKNKRTLKKYIKKSRKK